jgi:hypothetical protein
VVHVTPGAPIDTDPLFLAVDPVSSGGADVALTIRWLVDGAEQQDFAGSTAIPATRTHVGETWRAEVIATVAGRSSAPGSDEVTIGATVEPPRPPGAGSGLCAASGTGLSSRYALSSCTSPVEAASTPMTSSRYSLTPGPVEVR